jgi:hypothetical protein
VKRFLVMTAILSLPLYAQETPLIAEGKSQCQVCVRADAAPWEKRAAQDLCSTMEKITGVRPALGSTLGSQFNLVVGELALTLEPKLRQRLQQVAKANPVLRADAIVLQRQGQRLYLAGSNEDSHYFAVAELLRRWGCRWYLPSPLGECIPTRPGLSIGALDFAYAPPFEVRHIWISWNGDSTGFDVFARRNFLNQVSVPAGHSLSKYTKGIEDFSLVSPQSAARVADQVKAKFAQGESFSLSMEDGVMATKSSQDLEMAANLEDKFFHSRILSDNYLTFLNAVCALLRQAHPESASRIGFLAYVNLTLPPQRPIQAAAPLVAYLAPIDMDPNHAMGDPRSPELEDLRGIVAGWIRAMQGRVVLYDYDQGMLLWRDVPNPSHHVVAKNVQEYRRMGLLGFGTESRNAAATTFLNLYFRAQLYWNPDLSVQDELTAFYPNFYGPAAARLAAYWQLIFEAWKETAVTEHEYFVIPAIYPRRLVLELGKQLASLPPLPQPYLSRLRFTQLGYAVLDNYTQMIEAANSQCDYATAVRCGEMGLQARQQLTEMDGTFTTYTRMPEKGAAFWPGEVQQYRELAQLPLVLKTPLMWDLKRDPFDHGLWQNWAHDPLSPGWETVRSDRYLQAQGILTPDQHSPPGYAWYRCRVAVPESGQLRLMLPGLFNESWLYWDGKLLAHRPQKSLWWRNPYEFSWDVELGPVSQGSHWIVIRNRMELHMSGLFRRPFLYTK